MARSSSEHVRHHAAPRISANDLARYMVAGETGKHGIIRRAREAKTSTTVRYSRVRDDIAAFLCDPARTSRQIGALINKYEALADDGSLGKWNREDARLSMDVLASLARMENLIAGGRFVATPKRQVPMVLNGVAVSVNLNVYQVRARGGVDEAGGILFRLTKADEETDAAASKRREIGAYSATLALMQMGEKPLAGHRNHHQLCASFDIQCQEVHVAPRNYALKAKELENACRFIAAMWDEA